MSYFSRLAVATRGFRGGAGQSLYISQSFDIEDTDLTRAQIIQETVDVAAIETSTLSVVVDIDSGTTVYIDQSSAISIDVESSSQTISVSTC